MLPNIGLGELTVIVLIALLVFGPKRLPEMMRAAGKAIGSLQRESSKAMQELRDATNVVGDLGAPPDLGAFTVPDAVPDVPAPVVAEPAAPQPLAPAPEKRAHAPRASRTRSPKPAAKSSPAKPATKPPPPKQTAKRAPAKSAPKPEATAQPATQTPPPADEPFEDT